MSTTATVREKVGYAAYDIDTTTYDRAVRFFRFSKRFLQLHLNLHDPNHYIQRGHIFVFNHFARFETLIPQYLIYECCGAYCCAIAHRELFEIDEYLSDFLLATGAIPHDHPELFPLLATQILRGRKVIIFPEGGMVKDRRVIDRKGRYSIFSRTTRERRKQHTGAAVLGLGLDVFKQAVLYAARHGHHDKLDRWQQVLGISDMELLLSRCRQPTLIVPANITFFPLRIDPNFLEKLITTLRPGLKKRFIEELIIESNLLLKETDMDIRPAPPIQASRCWLWWERMLIGRVVPQLQDLPEIYGWHCAQDRFKHLLAKRQQTHAKMIRNLYMEAMYKAVTVNLCHLAATLIYHCIEQTCEAIDKPLFHRSLYLAIKTLQKHKTIHLHRSLLDPDCYQTLPNGESRHLQQFLCTAESAELMEPVAEKYQFLPKLREEFAIDMIRLENPVAVYANEVAPLSLVRKSITEAFVRAPSISPYELALLGFDDEVRSWQWDRELYSAPCPEIDAKEISTVPGKPFLFNAKPKAKRSVLLIHGLLAIPAVMRPLGEELANAGYTVLGVRLKGHGTSPCDLRERSWREWLQSVWRGYRILAAMSESIAVVGFSTGALLALQLAADQPDLLTAVAAITPALKFRSPIIQLVPLMHQANRLTRWVTDEGMKEFVENASEHPETNYTHIPIRALYELRLLIHETEQRLKDIHYPTLILQGDQDPVIDPEGAQLAYDQLASRCKTLTMIHSPLHDIVFHDPGEVHATIRFFLDQYTTYSHTSI